MRLPRAGIEIDGPHLRIARAGNPVIDLDARLLDGVRGATPAARDRKTLWTLVVGATVALAPATIFGGAVVLLPVTLAALAAGEGVRRWRDGEDGVLELTLGRLGVGLQIADGPAAAARAAEALAPWTRAAPIHDPSVYQDARRRLAAHAAGGAAPDEERPPVSLGQTRVRVAGETLHVGERGFPVAEVRALAERGAILAVAPGIAVQAAIALLVVAAEARRVAGEDLTGLRERVAAYEQWSGRSAGR